MKSHVFFVPLSNNEAPEIIEKKLKRLLTASGFDARVPEKGLTAVKTHFGEKNSVTHIPPRFFRPLSARIRQAGGRPFFTETSTLYKGSRSDAPSHLMHAENHGFTAAETGMPVIMADGVKGEWETEVEIASSPGKTVMVAGLLARIHAIVCVAHPTGHGGMGFGGAIKNLGMGLSSRRGKRVMHSSVKPFVNAEKCTRCGHCLLWCPEDAIILGDKAAEIDAAKCIGCGECLVECRFDAIKYDWGMEGAQLQEGVAEHALGAVKGKALFCISVLVNFTRDCDCFGTAKTRLIDDFGLLASPDPVAIDEAAMDLIEKREGKPLSDIAYPGIDPRIQTRHGEKIGLGSREYGLTTLEA